MPLQKCCFAPTPTQSLIVSTEFNDDTSWLPGRVPTSRNVPPNDCFKKHLTHTLNTYYYMHNFLACS